MIWKKKKKGKETETRNTDALPAGRSDGTGVLYAVRCERMYDSSEKNGIIELYVFYRSELLLS